MIERVPVADVFEEDACFYVGPETRHGFLIDPGAEADRLYEFIVHLSEQPLWAMPFFLALLELPNFQAGTAMSYMPAL